MITLPIDPSGSQEYLNLAGLESRTPELLINKYIWEQFRLADQNFYDVYINNGIRYVPIFPLNDGNADGNLTLVGDKPYILYDNFVKARTGQDRYFYPIKSQQMLYSIKGATVKEVYAMRQIIIGALDREDAAAEDVNNFVGVSDIKFQCINAYQVTYMKDSTNLDTTRSPYTADLIVKFDYHMNPINASYN